MIALYAYTTPNGHKPAIFLEKLGLPSNLHCVFRPSIYTTLKALFFQRIQHTYGDLTMVKLYGHDLSGNSYKVRLLLELLNLEYDYTQVDLMNGEHKQPAYLAINPFGQVPALVDGDVTLADAQGILTYLARQYGGETWLPTDPVSLSRVVRWLSTTAGEVRQGPEHARLYHLFGVKAIDIVRAGEKAAMILKQLDDHLSTRTWLEFERPTGADIAVFPYVALAPDGQIELKTYPHVVAWIERMKRLPGFIGMRNIDAPTPTSA